MTDLALDINPASPTYRDIYLAPNGDLASVDGKDAILQNILQTLGIFKGEWFLDVTIGIDYFGQVLIKNPVASKINAIFINQILNIAGVTRLNSFSAAPDFVKRIFAIKFSVTTTQGIVNYAGLI